MPSPKVLPLRTQDAGVFHAGMQRGGLFRTFVIQIKKGSQPSEPPQDLPATHPTDLCPSEALNLSTTEVAPWEEMRCRQATGQEDSEDPKNKLQAHWWDLCRVVGSGVHCEPWHQGNQELPSYTSGLVESGQVGEEPS